MNCPYCGRALPTGAQMCGFCEKDVPVSRAATKWLPFLVFASLMIGLWFTWKTAGDSPGPKPIPSARVPKSPDSLLALAKAIENDPGNKTRRLSHRLYLLESPRLIGVQDLQNPTSSLIPEYPTEHGQLGLNQVYFTSGVQPMSWDVKNDKLEGLAPEDASDATFSFAAAYLAWIEQGQAVVRNLRTGDIVGRVGTDVKEVGFTRSENRLITQHPDGTRFWELPELESTGQPIEDFSEILELSPGGSFSLLKDGTGYKIVHTFSQEPGPSIPIQLPATFVDDEVLLAADGRNFKRWNLETGQATLDSPVTNADEEVLEEFRWFPNSSGGLMSSKTATGVLYLSNPPQLPRCDDLSFASAFYLRFVVLQDQLAHPYLKSHPALGRGVPHTGSTTPVLLQNQDLEIAGLRMDPSLHPYDGGRHLITESSGALRAWDCRALSYPLTLHPYSNNNRLDPSGSRLFCSSRGFSWTPVNDNEPRPVYLHKPVVGEYADVFVSQDTETVVAFEKDGETLVFKRGNEEPIGRGPAVGIWRDVAVSPEGSTLAVLYEHGNYPDIRTWNFIVYRLPNFEILLEADVPINDELAYVVEPQVSPYHFSLRRRAGGQLDATLIWDLESESMQQLALEPMGISHDGKYGLFGGTRREQAQPLELWDLSNHTPVLELNHMPANYGGVWYASLSGDGNRVLYRDPLNRLICVDRLGNELFTRPFRGMAYLNDDGSLAFDTHDYLGRFYDGESGEPIGPEIPYLSQVLDFQGTRLFFRSYHAQRGAVQIGTLELEADLDCPTELVLLESQVWSGQHLDGREMSRDEFEEMRARWKEAAAEHAKQCAYPKANTWLTLRETGLK
jgi:hypothetical protein